MALALACALPPCHRGRAGATVSVPAVGVVSGEQGRTRDQKPTQALLVVLKIGGISARLDSVTFSLFVMVQPRVTCDAVGLRCVFQVGLPFRGLSAQLRRGNGLLKVGFFWFGFSM